MLFKTDLVSYCNCYSLKSRVFKIVVNVVPALQQDSDQANCKYVSTTSSPHKT